MLLISINVDRAKAVFKYSSTVREAPQSQRVQFLRSESDGCCCHLDVSAAAPQSSLQGALVHSYDPVVNLPNYTIILSTILCHHLINLMGTWPNAPLKSRFLIYTFL